MNILVLDPDGRIVAWQQGPAKPADDDTRRYVAVDDAGFAAYHAAAADMRGDGRGDLPMWTDGAVAVPADTRALFRVTIETAHDEIDGLDWIIADGVDAATVTVECVDGEGKVITAFNGARVVPLFEDRLALLNYVDGVAVKSFATPRSGHYSLANHPDYRLTGEVHLLAVEV